jgi:hypothetical protein
MKLAEKSTNVAHRRRPRLGLAAEIPEVANPLAPLALTAHHPHPVAVPSSSPSPLSIQTRPNFYRPPQGLLVAFDLYNTVAGPWGDKLIPALTRVSTGLLLAPVSTPIFLVQVLPSSFLRD